MKALVFDGFLRLDRDYPDPEPAPAEARVRTLLAGICNTDLEVVRGYADFRGVLGHEFVGVVDRAEDPDLVGRRVVGAINIGCGACRSCRLGQPEHCITRTALGVRAHDGALSEYLTLPAANLLVVPDEVPDRAAVFCEPLAAACEILEQVHVREADRVVVLGDGKLGLLAAQVLSHTRCGLTVIGRHEDKLAVAGRLGIDTRLSETAEDDLAGAVDVVIECTGSPDGFRVAQHLVRPRGTIVLKSTYAGLISADLSRLVVDEVHVIGSRCGPMRAALRLLAERRVDVESLIQAEFSLDDGVAALEYAARPGVLKVLVRAAASD